MKSKTDKFSVHYDRIVDYNLPKTATDISQPSPTLKNGKKVMSMALAILIILLSALMAFGATWLYNQANIKTDISVPENVIMEDKATRNVMGRP